MATETGIIMLVYLNEALKKRGGLEQIRSLAELRQAVIETLSDIAGQSDGVRCDMAMLLLNQIFERTWGNRAGQRPATEYWVDVISAIKKAHPDFLFMAEAYWNLEWELQQQGFVERGPEGVRALPVSLKAFQR